MDQTGTLTLRANVANYSRAVKTGTWHLAREQEPKDYDINRGGFRNLCRSTYNRMATVTDGGFPMTTYNEMTLGTMHLKNDFADRPPAEPMLSLKNLSSDNQSLERSIEALGIKSTVDNDINLIFPKPDRSRNKMSLETTHLTDFKWRLPMSEPDTQNACALNQGCAQSDLDAAWRRCHSQFTDWDNHRRPGRNTWKDESGIFANSHLKAQLPIYQPTETVPPWKE